MDWQQLTILVVDDEPALRRLLETFLGGLGAKIILAEDVPSARATLTEHIDIAIVDVGLPKEDGYSLLPDLTARGIPGIIYTGYVTDESRRVAFERGAAGYIEKPFLMKDMLSLLEYVLSA